MSWQERGKRERKRERMVMSLLSLLIVGSLLGGYAYLRASQEPLGKLGSISTAAVTISVNEVPAPVPQSEQEAAAAPSPTATPGRAAAGGRGPGVVAEVLSSGEQASATTSGRPDLSTSAPASAAGQSASSQAPAGATATATTVRTGLSIPTTAPGSGGVPTGGGGVTGGSGGGGGDPVPPALGSTPTPPPGATTAPTGPTPRPGATSAPVSPTLVPTFEPDDGTPAGHNSHLHIDGVVAPGAYTTGGIIVSNVGPVAFNYSVSMNVAGSVPFGSILRYRIYLRVGSTCNYPGQPPAPSASFLPLTGDQVGTVLYDGTFASGNKLGNPAVELATGDRPLDIGQSEVLCMEVFFPWTAGNEFQGLAVNGTLIFTAKSPE